MILLRHPRTCAAPGLCYGRLDLKAGPTAATEMDEALRAICRPGPVFTSPARRCRTLADRLAASTGGEPRIDPRLHELDFGTWEGRAWDDVDRAESEPWARDPCRVSPPGGETFAALLARVGAALAELPEEAIVVTHAGPIRAARMILLGESFEAVFASAVPHCVPFELQRERV